MSETNYAPPLDKLLNFGYERDEMLQDWPDYLAYGFTNEDIPELIRLATDTELLFEADEDDSAVWGPIHASRVLGQLQAEEAVEPLIKAYPELVDADWAIEELPVVYGMIGAKAIPHLTKALADENSELTTRINVATGLVEVAQRHPELRDEVVDILTHQLEKYETQDEELNGFIIGDLVDLKALETYPLMEKAFAANRVDYFAAPQEWVQVQFGLITEAEANQIKQERQHLAYEQYKTTHPSPAKPTLPSSQRNKAVKAKEKNKRKIAQASRKKNRKK